jgi:hypothetical protein
MVAVFGEAFGGVTVGLQSRLRARLDRLPTATNEFVFYAIHRRCCAFLKDITTHVTSANNKGFDMKTQPICASLLRVCLNDAYLTFEAQHSFTHF